jgi:hypothetical protein
MRPPDQTHGHVAAPGKITANIDRAIMAAVVNEDQFAAVSVRGDECSQGWTALDQAGFLVEERDDE